MGIYLKGIDIPEKNSLKTIIIPDGSASEAADYLIRNGAKWETIEQ